MSNGLFLADIVQQRRSDAVLAGMTWHSIFSTDLRERERLVEEHVQAKGIEQLCVMEFPGGLQIGYCERARLPLTTGRGQRWLSFAMLVRKHFMTDSLLMVWRIQRQDNTGHYAVLVFEEGALLLDRVVTAGAVENLVTTYLENIGSRSSGHFLTNDIELFPEFTDVSELDWIETPVDSARLRAPRPARLIDAERRPVQAFFIVAGLIAASLVIAWYVWTTFVAKPKPVASRPKASPQETYLRTVTEQIATLGFSSDGIRDLMMALMKIPLVHEGWTLQMIVCDQKDCRLFWQGTPGLDSRVLTEFGSIDTGEGGSRKKGKRTVVIGQNTIQIKRPHDIKMSGVITADRLRSKADAKLYCEREGVVMKQLQLRSSMECTGKPWPDSANALPAELVIERFGLSFTADWVTMDRLLDRFEDAIFWQELRIMFRPEASEITELMVFELSGDLYAYR